MIKRNQFKNTNHFSIDLLLDFSLHFFNEIIKAEKERKDLQNLNSKSKAAKSPKVISKFEIKINEEIVQVMEVKKNEKPNTKKVFKYSSELQSKKGILRKKRFILKNYCLEKSENNSNVLNVSSNVKTISIKLNEGKSYNRSRAMT